MPKFLLTGLDIGDTVIPVPLEKGTAVIKRLTPEIILPILNISNDAGRKRQDFLNILSRVVTSFRLTLEGGIGCQYQIVMGKIRQFDTSLPCRYPMNLKIDCKAHVLKMN